MTEREFAVDVVNRLRGAGYEALWAGGCVRDELLGLVPDDYDIATNARPEEVMKLFRRTVAVGASFGVVQVLGPASEQGRLTVEVATFRSDAGYSDGRHPDAVIFSSAQEDALRRDFTINGMFFDPIDNRLIDYVGGREDLGNKILRAIGDPAVRFAEDKLRMLRAVRLATRFALKIEGKTAEAIQAMAAQITVVSAERIAEELRKLLVHPQRARGVNLLHDLGLAAAIVPELLPMKGLPQGPPQAPTGDLWDHVMRVLELAGPQVSFPLAFAALLHDVGKPRMVGRTPDRYTFYGHEHVGRRMSEDIAARLKLSNVERERLSWLVEKHQFLCEARHMRLSKLKQTLVHPGIAELLALHRADAMASGRSTDHVEYCEELLARWTAADLDPAPLATGDDLVALGLEPGPNFKRLLDAVREAQLEGTIRTKAQALELIRRMLEEKEDT
ncbi:MAG TPA: CCA tRNA nucleotidyltransferase [Gemmataceae bacterium]|jgi:poly(A) polymerase|nr:CCA tRNA nucleotidyltransferase [Gemmataceae bacterium]